MYINVYIVRVLCSVYQAGVYVAGTGGSVGCALEVEL